MRLHELQNMDRRKFLTAAGVTLGTALAGCSGLGGTTTSSEDQFEFDDGKEQHALGESVEYGGLEVTLSDPVLANHYATYDCSGSSPWEEDDAVQCSPPEADSFEDPPTQGGQFMAIQVTMRHVGERRISLPFEASAFDLANDGHPEDEFLIEDPWVSAAEVFPSWVFFVQEHEMNEQGVFPGVSVRGYIAFEVPIQSDLNELTGIVRWAGNEDEEQEVYWDVTAEDVEDLTGSSPPSVGGDIFYEPRAGGVDWGENGEPETGSEDGINWEFDGDGDYHVPDSQQDDEESDSTTG